MEKEEKSYSTIEEAYEEWKKTGEFNYKSGPLPFDQDGSRTYSNERILGGPEWEKFKERSEKEGLDLYYFNVVPEDPTAKEYYIVVKGRKREEKKGLK